jgi:hypothetical protein
MNLTTARRSLQCLLIGGAYFRTLGNKIIYTTLGPILPRKLKHSFHNSGALGCKIEKNLVMV